MQAVSRAPEDGSGRHEVDEDAVWRFSQQPQRRIEDEAGVLVGDSRCGWVEAVSCRSFEVLTGSEVYLVESCLANFFSLEMQVDNM